MNKHMFEQFLKRGAALSVIASMFLAGLPVSAAREIYQLGLGRDVIARDGKTETGDYLQVQYGVRDFAANQSYNSLVFTKVASMNDTTPSTLSNSMYMALPHGSWLYDAAGTMKIDADRINLTASPFGVYRVEVKSFNVNGTVPNWPAVTTPLKTSIPKYFVLFPKIDITNFDLDGMTQAGTVIDPIVLKQDGATTGDYLKVTRAYGGAASSSLAFGAKNIDLPAGIGSANIDADKLPVGKSIVKLKAFSAYSGKEKAVLSGNSFTVTVLAEPKFSKLTITDTNATKDGAKPSNCALTSANISGNDKVVFKYDGVGLTAATMKLTNGANTYSFKLVSPNGLGRFTAIDADCLPNGTYSAVVDYENTGAYRKNLTTTTQVVVN